MKNTTNGNEKTAVESPKIDQKEAARLLRRRNIAVMLVLFGFACVFFVLTIARLGPAAFMRELG